MRELQYPVELGSTVGGRIVGELNVDFLLPTYQKNDFDRTDRSWQQLVDFVCGAGPYLPKSRKAAGFTDPIEAPIPLLANAYRRCDPGTKCLFVPGVTAKQFLAEFRSGKPEYQGDELWFKAAQEEDQRKRSGGETTVVNPGDDTTDDIDVYFPPTDSQLQTPPEAKKPVQTPIEIPAPTSAKEELLSRSKEIYSLSGKYSFGTIPPFAVRAYELISGDIKVNGESKACFFDNIGIDCVFIYNPKHPALSQFRIADKVLVKFEEGGKRAFYIVATGLGKTVIAAEIAHRLWNQGLKKILVLSISQKGMFPIYLK